MGERIKESIPGTREYEATHGMTGGHRGAEQLKSHIPGESASYRGGAVSRLASVLAA
jgi:hypothetical protein